jgi:hypothetical protein
VDALLHNQVPTVQVRERDPTTGEVRVQQVKYDQVSEPSEQQPLGQSKYTADFDSALAEKRRATEAAAAGAAAAAAAARAGAEAVAAAAAAAAATASADGEEAYSSSEEEANNALPFSLKELVSVSSGGSGGSAGWAGSFDSGPSVGSSGRGFGPSSFAKPQVGSVMGGGKHAGSGKRSKGKASARKSSR